MQSTAPTKYGNQLTGGTWPGWTMRVGHFPGDGSLCGLTATADTVLVWSGGASNVCLRIGGAVHAFRRQSGMVDFLPAGTVIDRVQWDGEATGCVSTVLQPSRAAAWLGEAHTPFEPEQDLRLCVTDAHIVDLVRRLQAQAQSGQPWGPLYVEGLSLALASYVYGRYSRRAALDVARDAELANGLRDYARPANTNDVGLRSGFGLTHAQCDRLISFIEENLSRSITLADLAELVRYSTDHFARLFKRSFGVPAHQYVLERRIERAKSLLRDRRRSMLEVALACGFSSQAHFNFAFKRRVGVTPGIYRKG